LTSAESKPLPEGNGAGVSHRIGLDANRPIDPRTGRIQPQVADPDVIASSGAGWVRLNCVLGPWSHPKDRNRHGGRTWAQTYRQIIRGFREKGLKIYGLIGFEAMPTDPGNRFRDRPLNADADDAWLDQYIAHFVAIVEMLHHDIEVFESVNEPDDFRGQNRNWIHAGWFAILLQRIYSAVRARPDFQHIKLVSGPLQGLQINNNGAVHYLYNTYQAGKQWLGWGQPSSPFPFDGVGYHIYVREAFDPDRVQQERAVRTTYSRYLDAMHRLIRQEEGQDKPLYVSEMGFNSRIEAKEIRRRETFQANSLRVGLETIFDDPLVELGVCFCTQDFSTGSGEKYYGLYRPGTLTPDNRKPAFHSFRAFCRGDRARVLPEDEPFTNQQVIDAFYQAAVELGLENRWSLLAKSGIRLGSLAANRSAVYDGTPVHHLPNLTEREKALIQDMLEEQLSAAHPVRQEAALTGSLEPGWQQLGSTPGTEGDHDLSLALQEYTIQQLEHNIELLERTLGGLSSRGYTIIPANKLLLAVGIVSFLIAVVASVLTVLLASQLLP
jgi:hypothetical protein